jgi:hypothetical protein
LDIRSSCALSRQLAIAFSGNARRTHFTRASDIIVPDHLTTRPSVSIAPHRDVFGNWCSRIVAPAGSMRLPNSEPAGQTRPQQAP